jgi:para-aminobenzoate synthetase component I
LSSTVKIKSIQTFKLEKSPDLLQLSYITGSQKDRALFFSSGLHPLHGRFSILVLNPLFSIESDFGELLKALFSIKDFSQINGMPMALFSGWMNYEYLEFIEKVDVNKKSLQNVPAFHFVFSDSFIVVDNFEKRVELVLLETNHSVTSINERKQLYFEELAADIPDIDYELGAIKAKALISKKKYVEAIDEIRRRIGDGDVYQVNFTYPVEIKTEIPSWVLFYKYLAKNHADYAAFINSSEVEVLSISPECFFRIENGEKVSSFPIKGTIKKGINQQEDQSLKFELAQSRKDLAELSMIVDLIRNDIGKVAVPGTVKVEKHAELFEFPTLFHLVSTVSGKIEKDKAIELFKSLFPGGSITGAPKISAMKIISELEEYKRNIYTGAIGFTGLGGNAVFNIPIRTVQKVGNVLIYSTGGGITFKSDPEKEFEETLVKTKAFLNIFDDAEIVFE